MLHNLASENLAKGSIPLRDKTPATSAITNDQIQVGYEWIPHRMVTNSNYGKLPPPGTHKTRDTTLRFVNNRFLRK